MSKAQLVKEYNIIEKDFDRNLVNLYDLSILVGMDRFFYAISRKKQTLVLRTRHFPMHNYLQLQAAFRDIFRHDKLLQLAYHQTHIRLLSPTTTLIPRYLYDANKTRFYLEHNAVLTKEDIVQEDTLQGIGAHQVYAFNQTIFETLQAQFSTAQFQHVLSGLIEAYEQFNIGKTVYANIIGTQLHIVVFDGRKLLFANTFTQHSDTDVMYFVGLIFNQLDLDAKKNKVVLSGEVDPESLTYFTLQKYIKHVEFSRRVDGLTG